MERQAVAKTQQNARRANHVQRQSNGPSLAAHPLASVQSSIGNQAIQRLISSQYIQTKLQISTPGDPFEQEADRVADTVMRMPETGVSPHRTATGIQTKSLFPQITPLIHRKVARPPVAVREDDEDEEKVAREIEPKPIPLEEEKEKTIAPKPISDTPIQRQSKDEDKEEESLSIAPTIQRQKAEEEDEEIAPKLFRQVTPDPVMSLSPQRPSVYRSVSVPTLPTISIQRLCTECEDELGQPKEDSGENENVVHRKYSAGEQEKTLQKKSGSEEIAASPDVENRLMNSKGSGSPLPSTIREQMESSFNADFSNVRIHTSSTAVGMNKDLHAHAFTHGSDIYFNSGKFDPNSQSGKHLLAHELTHTVQQQGGSARRQIQRWPDWVSDAAGWVSDTASDAAGAVVEGAEYVGGKVVGGARWVGGQVADGARWVGEQISAAAQYVIDQIRSAINSGTNYLTEQWENIKQFGSNCFDTIKTGFGNLVHFVTNPLSSLMSALSAMDADLLGSAWRLLKTGANALWEGIDSVIKGVLQSGEGIWNTVSGFINGIFNTVGGLFDSSAFDLLPDFIKNEARSVLNDLRSLWNQVSTFWTDLWQRLTSSVQEILAGVSSFVENVIGFSIDGVISMVRDLKEVYDYVMKFFADPRATIQPFLDQIAAKLNTEAPPRANTLGNQMALDNYQGGVTPTTANGSIQRQESDSEDRDTASFDEVGKGILYYIAKFWAELNIKDMLWQTVVNSFWPPATIEAICKEFSDLWNDHWATTVDSLYAPANFFEHPITCLHDLWSNFLILLDFPLSLWRTLNHVAGLLIGYVTIIVVLVEAILGGIAAAEAGVVPGLLAGAAAGLATMAPIGEALMASYLLAESSTVIIILTRLFTAKQTCEKRQVDISTSVASFISMAVALVLEVLMALLAELVNLIASVLKGTPKPVPQPQPVAPPARPGLPPPAPNPIPAPPQPQPVPVQPPAQPAVPAGGGGQVIPFPRRQPATPAQPGRIAAKFEDGVSQALFLETRNNNSSAKTADNSDRIRESNPENEGIPLLGIQDAEDGIIQTARKDKIDPDACKPKCKLTYSWWLQKGATAHRLIYCKDNKNFEKHEHHNWPKYLGGPDLKQDPLLPVAERIHKTEFHGGTGPIGTIHAFVEAALRASPVHKDLLGKDEHLTHLRSSTGNTKLITAMLTADNAADLRSFVKNTLIGYYGYYTLNSDPSMPIAAYSVGLNKAVNNIE